MLKWCVMNYKYINLKLHDMVFSLTMIHGKGKISRFLFAMITYNISDLFRKNTNNCKNGEEAHNETVRAYGAMGFLKLDYQIMFKIALGRDIIFY